MKKTVPCLWLGLSLLLLLFLSDSPPAPPEKGVSPAASRAETGSWIVKWKTSVDPAFLRESRILDRNSDLGTIVARPAAGENVREWLNRWKSSGDVQFFQANHRFRVAMTPNDPFLVKQSYLKQIHAEEAWDEARGNTSIVIAVVDTGIDLNHSELKANLVDGVNLLNPQLPPQDDNGHGTNIAGILAASGNNDKGVSGLLWNARIMPIKALEADGTGSEAKLGEGIRYAVDHGAKIVVLSLGLNKYTPYMSEIVQYAEDHGVLLVAATGNEGSAVKYPAAYPTVLAVGGMTPDKQADDRSNFGPELDLVAPMEVFTTAKNGGYEYKDGTSMAAPQAAAVAALVWGQHPEMKPYQIRNLLKQTAEDLGEPGWDPHTGYGLLRADRAIAADYEEGMDEPNNSKAEAKVLQLSKAVTAEISGSGDQDWFWVDSPYAGSLHVQVKPLSGSGDLRLTFEPKGGQTPTVYQEGLEQGIDLPLPVGRSYLQIDAEHMPADGVLDYEIITQPTIGPDPFEDNDKSYKSYVLPAKSQQIQGTFDHENDEDWFLFPASTAGKLRLHLGVDSARMDPVLTIQRKGEKPITVDRNGDGKDEESPILDILPGEYYIRIANAPEYVYPVWGQYTLELDYVEAMTDPNEPNDKPYEATPITSDATIEGVLNEQGDEDWFTLEIEKKSLVRIRLNSMTRNQQISLVILDQYINELARKVNQPESEDMDIDRTLEEGTYYIRLFANETLPNLRYIIGFQADPVVGGYADIFGHWAMNDILRMSSEGIVEGYGDLYFRPDELITREQAAALLARALKLPSGKGVNFSDLPPGHWSYGDVSRVVQEGVMDGYPDGSFRPGSYLTRREMAVLLARSLNLLPAFPQNSPFADVPLQDWAAGELAALKESGWIDGYADGTFRPDKNTTRAEFIHVVSLMLKR